MINRGRENNAESVSNRTRGNEHLVKLTKESVKKWKKTFEIQRDKERRKRRKKEKY